MNWENLSQRNYDEMKPVFELKQLFDIKLTVFKKETNTGFKQNEENSRSIDKD